MNANRAVRASRPVLALTATVCVAAVGVAEGATDLGLQVPNTININSPAFKQAATACGFH